MKAYIGRRLLLIIPTIILVTMIVFGIVRAIPGDIIEQMLADMSYHVGEEDISKIRTELGLDVPAPVQYLRWIKGIVTRGDFGDSLISGQPVVKRVLEALPISVELGFIAIVTSLIIALPIGIYSGMRQDTTGDYSARSLAIFLIAVPNFWVGTMIMVFPSLWWGWSPRMVYTPFFENPAGNLEIFIIPGILMGMHMSGTLMRMTRTMMLEVLRQDYIRTAWAKGLREGTVIMRHALKNALIPIITLVGVMLPVLVGGSIIMEQIFNLPGIGRLTLQALNQRDYTMVSALNLLVAIFVLCFNLAIDLTYGWLDPRISYK